MLGLSIRETAMGLIGAALLASAAGVAGYVRGALVAKTRVEARHAAELAAFQKHWAEQTALAQAQAYELGRQRTLATVQNMAITKEVRDAAAIEEGASDMCLSSDVLERLRKLH